MKSILLIEDCETYQFLAEIVITDIDDDITLYKAYDGEEALQILFEQGVVPDLILLDINMPRMNGHEFLVEYNKERKGEIPIVAMLTSSDQDSDKECIDQYSFVKDYIVKPLKSEHLLELKKLVEHAAVDKL